MPCRGLPEPRQLTWRSQVAKPPAAQGWGATGLTQRGAGHNRRQVAENGKAARRAALSIGPGHWEEDGHKVDFRRPADAIDSRTTGKGHARVGKACGAIFRRIRDSSARSV